MFVTKTINKVDYGDLEQAIRQLPFVADMPRDNSGYHPYEYVADNERENYATYDEYFDILSIEQATAELRAAAELGNSAGYGRLTRAALNYMAATGQLPPSALVDGCVMVRVFW